MDINKIYDKSTELCQTSIKKPFFTVILYIQVMGLLLSQIGTFFAFFGLLISSVMSFILTHGMITASLKAINGQLMDLNDDGRCGFRRSFELFRTYGWMYLIRLAIMAILLMVPIVVLISTMSNFESIESWTFVQDLEFETMLRRYVLITMSCELLANLISSFIYFPTMYLIETDHLHGLKALSAGFKMLKGHRKQLLSLELKYFSYMVIFLCLEFLLAVFVDSFFVILLTFILYGLEAYVYLVHYQISHVLFFYEMKGEVE